MKSENEIIVNDELIARYLCGEATPEEAMVLMDWLKDGNNDSHFRELQKTWQKVHPLQKSPRVELDKAWKKVDSNISTVRMHEKGRNTGKFKINSLALKIAASIIIVAIASLLFYPKHNRYPEENLSTGKYTGQFSLPDSTAVTLYRYTQLSYPKNFDMRAREVMMPKGEAFFNVVHDVQRPFIIHTPLGDIIVVGTAFNVALKEDLLEVGVREGRIMLYTQYDTVLVNTGHMGLIKSGSRQIIVEDSVNINSWAYATQKLVFRETPLEEVFDAIEKTYQNPIKVSDANINSCKLTATFDHVSAENLLHLVAEALNLTVRQDGMEFIIEGEGCN